MVHVNVGIVGGSGYGGAELLRLLAGHPALKVHAVAARSSAGQRLAEVFPSLASLPEVPDTLVPATVDALEGCAVVFLATPHEAALALTPELLDAGATVVDLSAAFRLEASAFAAAYGEDHPLPELTPAPYGLPELFRDELVGARLIAGPGCYPTASLLALAPLAGLVDPASVTVVGMSGWSGAGKGLRDDLHAPHASGNVNAYAAPRHRHTAEISAGWSRIVGRGGQPRGVSRGGGIARAGDTPRFSRAPTPVTFVPHLVPMPRGLLATITATLTAAADDIRPAYEAAYATEACVHLLPEGVWPQSTHVLGANTAHVNVAVDHAAGRVIASCAIDNLTKGAAGQALQAANVALGLPETAGLPLAAVYP